jgi:hypothetical protein
MSDIMSIVTVRELHRNTASVLETCEHEGKVIVRRRNGKEYRIEPVPASPAKKPEWPDFRARAARIRSEPIPADICAKVDAAIRGE